ncbi:WD40 repeat-like protein [Aulographum hederae CBS 113979]|uniref:WD40 repeat-like protein n=1 Tax=Aulographum hederae CBS 113979 TaxID=1176131 RepID=A0A6G1HD68_9PEZI|nr:WD40 repeat-like protein [Aulographum hederae CBS 113979]
MRHGTSPGTPHANGTSNGFSGPSSNVANGSSASNGTHANGNQSVAAPEPLSSMWHGHDREEVTRILIQGLTDLGYHNSALSLSEESGHQLEGPTVAAFRNSVLQGDWAEAEVLLFGSGSDDTGGVELPGGRAQSPSGISPAANSARRKGLTLKDGADVKEMLFSLREQKYLELLEVALDQKDATLRTPALEVLRCELTPLGQATSRLHAITRAVVFSSSEDLKAQLQWDGAGGASRSRLLSKLSKSISPRVMIPEHRLGSLLTEIKDTWINGCLYHNTADSPSLYVDHVCDPSDVPLAYATELKFHVDEVWFLAWSPDGEWLATSGKDKRVLVYKKKGRTLVLSHTFSDHESGVCYLSWSPDSSKLISCTKEEDSSARVWDINTGDCIMAMNRFAYAVTAAAWAPDGDTIVIGTQDTNEPIGVWSLRTRNKIHTISETDRPLRVYDLALCPDGKRVVVLGETRIIIYELMSKKKLHEWAMDVKLTSLDISRDGTLMLVGMNDSRIQLLDIDTCDVQMTFHGHTQRDFMIRSSFGGAGDGFVISGSEDSRLYIWRTTGQLVASLAGHGAGCVNTAVWNPKYRGLIASASDDKTVRLYVPPMPSSPVSIFELSKWTTDTSPNSSSSSAA